MNNKVKQHSLAWITILFWSLAFALTRYATTELSYYTIGLVRATVASVVLLSVGYFTHMRLPIHKSHILLFALEGFMGFALYLVCFNIGMQTLPSATSSLIISLTPSLTAIGASFIFKEKLKKTGWICMVTAFIGVCILLLWNGDFSLGIGAMWTLIAVVLFSGYNLLNSKLGSMGYSALEIVAYSMTAGALELMVFLPKALPEITHTSALPIAIVIFLGVTASAIAYLTWSKAMEYAENISEVTTYLYVSPILAAIEGAIILGEIPNAGIYIGGSIILISVMVFAKKGK